MASLVLFFFIGEGVSVGFGQYLRLTARESAMMAAFAALWLGLVLGWKRELWGGLLTIAGVAAFYILSMALSGGVPRGPCFLLIASPGALFVLYGILAGRQAAPV